MINLNLEEGQITIQFQHKLEEQYRSITYWFIKEVLSPKGGPDLKTEFGVNA